ncbi:Phage antirepressor protein [Enterococcus faecium]|uniref:BRO-N domain-containing protein n=1 Tax=Enterococcus faecium TaxID=1352 RepID=UPI0009899FC9|nr:BRO family protein [Enterococcus faecium]SJX71648.1 Phage antirepressor protein [Enterococcus faecium]
MKTEIWNGHTIRFVEIDNEWWAVAKDVAEALGIVSIKDSLRKMDSRYKGAYKVPTLGGLQKMLILNEKGLYRLIMRSNKKEAEQFQDWVFDVIKQLRRSVGIEGFQVFRMLDKEHQKEAMTKLSHAITEPKPVDYIKANVIANKAVSTIYGHSKMVKKKDMTPEMLVDREPILDETVELMAVKEKYGLNFSVSEKIYNRFAELQTA